MSAVVAVDKERRGEEIVPAVARAASSGAPSRRAVSRPASSSSASRRRSRRGPASAPSAVERPMPSVAGKGSGSVDSLIADAVCAPRGSLPVDADLERGGAVGAAGSSHGDMVRWLRGATERLRSVAQSYLPRRDFKDFSKCGHPVDAHLGQYIVDAEKGVAYQVSRSCRSPWICPVCSSRYQWAQSLRVADALSAAFSQGVSVVLATFTVPHKRGDKLSDLLSGTSSAYRSMMRARSVSRRFKELDLVGHIRAWDIVWSPTAGWHPHLHNLYFFRNDPDAAVLESEFWHAWEPRVARELGVSASRRAMDVRIVRPDADVPADGHGFVAASSEIVARYVSKFRMARYLLKNDDGEAQNAGSFYAFDLLDPSDPEKLALFREFAYATKGRSRIRWSKGLAASLGVQSYADRRAAEKERAKSSRVYQTIPAGLFDVCRRFPEFRETLCSFLEDPQQVERRARMVDMIVRAPLDGAFWSSAADKEAAMDFARLYDGPSDQGISVYLLGSDEIDPVDEWYEIDAEGEPVVPGWFAGTSAQWDALVHGVEDWRSVGPGWRYEDAVASGELPAAGDASDGASDGDDDPPCRAASRRVGRSVVSLPAGSVIGAQEDIVGDEDDPF